MSSLMDVLAGGGGGPPGAGPQGAPPGPGPGGPGLPPDPAMLLGPQGGPPGGGPPGQTGGGVPGKPDNPDAESALQDAIDAIHAFLQAEEDDQDKATASKCLAQLQAIFGGRQKQDEAAQGITPAHKAMGRAMSKRPPGGPSGGPPGGAPGGY